MPDLTDFQLEVTRLFFSLPASKGFLLAGGAALLAQHLTRPTEDLDFFTAPDRGHVPAARDALEAAARKRGWTVERIHDSDTFCRLVIRSDTAEIATDLAVDTPPDFPCLYYGCRAHAGSRGTRRPQAASAIRPGRGTGLRRRATARPALRQGRSAGPRRTDRLGL